MISVSSFAPSIFSGTAADQKVRHKCHQRRPILSDLSIAALLSIFVFLKHDLWLQKRAPTAPSVSCRPDTGAPGAAAGSCEKWRGTVECMASARNASLYNWGLGASPQRGTGEELKVYYTLEVHQRGKMCILTVSKMFNPKLSLFKMLARHVP